VVGSDGAHSLVTAEPIPSAGGVGGFVEADGRVGAAGGYLLQAMPGAEPGTIDRLERNVREAAPPSDLVRQGLEAGAILDRLLAGFPTRVLEERAVRFRCRCSRDRVAATILALGRDELLDLLAGERRAEVVCEFCAARYQVEEPELRALVAGL
jgi:molecular chaperone Hsp33